LAIAFCRVFVYVCSMGALILFHVKHMLRDMRNRNFVRLRYISVPAYLRSWQDAAGLMLAIVLALMLCLEPLLYCLQSSTGETRVTEECPDGQRMIFMYSILSSIAALFYFSLTIDVSVLSTSLSAFVLVCFQLLSQVALFLLGFAFFAITFASAITAVQQRDPLFASIPQSFLSLSKITFRMFDGRSFDALHGHPILLFLVFCYIVCTVIFLVNLLISQLSTAYLAIYQDMLGFARLNRGHIIQETMPHVTQRRWELFKASLRLDDRLEFGEGDLGITGGVQVQEPAALNVTTVDMIRRFGGSTCPSAVWPEEEDLVNDDEDRIEQLEKLINKLTKKMASAGTKAGANTSSGGGSSANSGDSEGDSVDDSD